MQVTSLLSREEHGHDHHHHDHEHGPSCGCGADHEHAPVRLWQTLIGIVFVINAFLVDWFFQSGTRIASGSAMIGSIILGYPIVVTAIKDLKVACLADRLSDHRFWANQFRLLLHAAAYWLLDTLRRWLRTMRVARMQLDTLRLRLLKIGGRVSQLRDRVRLRLASSHPGQPLWDQLAAHRLLRE